MYRLVIVAPGDNEALHRKALEAATEAVKAVNGSPHARAHLEKVEAPLGMRSMSQEQHREVHRHPWQAQFERLWKTDYDRMVQTLATYIAERNRGVVHTPEWQERMARLQREHDAARDFGCQLDR